MKRLVIYHAQCQDGFGGAYCLWRLYRNNAEYVPALYGSAVIDTTGRDVVMVDFSYQFADMVELCKKAKSVIVLDHHKSARDDLERLKDLKLPNVTLLFDMERSGAMMGWDYAFPIDVPPRIIRHIQDRDLWRFLMRDTRAICAALASYPMEFEVWHRIVQRAEQDEVYFHNLVDQGEAIDRQHRAYIECLKPNAVIQEIGGYRVPVCNANHHLASDLANALAHGHPFAATYFDKPDARVYSLRSTKDGIDVSIVAAGYGGGGHKHAAGFSLPHLTPPGAVPYQIIAPQPR